MANTHLGHRRSLEGAVGNDGALEAAAALDLLLPGFGGGVPGGGGGRSGHLVLGLIASVIASAHGSHPAFISDDDELGGGRGRNAVATRRQGEDADHDEEEGGSPHDAHLGGSFWFLMVLNVQLSAAT